MNMYLLIVHLLLVHSVICFETLTADCTCMHSRTDYNNNNYYCSNFYYFEE